MSLSTGAVWAGRVQNAPCSVRAVTSIANETDADRATIVAKWTAPHIAPSSLFAVGKQMELFPETALARVHESCAVWQAVVGNAEPLLHRIEVSGVHNFRSESSLLEITSG